MNSKINSLAYPSTDRRMTTADAEATISRSQPQVAARFWPKVAKAGPGDCWEWTGYRHKIGYGQLTVGGHRDCRPIGSHRVAWILTRGPIPPGMSILHQCDNRGCCNPAHMRLGTQAENMADRFTRTGYTIGGRPRRQKQKELV